MREHRQDRIRRIHSDYIYIQRNMVMIRVQIWKGRKKSKPGAPWQESSNHKSVKWHRQREYIGKLVF